MLLFTESFLLDICKEQNVFHIGLEAMKSKVKWPAFVEGLLSHDRRQRGKRVQEQREREG